jgi:hypothetical protein
MQRLKEIHSDLKILASNLIKAPIASITDAIVLNTLQESKTDVTNLESNYETMQ